MAHLDHKEAFEDFKARVLEGITTHFPVRGRLQTLELEGLEVKDDALHADDIRGQHAAKLEGKSWAAPVLATLKLVNNQTGQVVDKKRVRVADLPMVTRRYSYIVDGQEYQVDNQWQLKPGVYTRRRQDGDLETRFNVPNKQSFDVTFQPETKVFMMERGKSKNIPVYPLLKALGIDDDLLEKHWGKDVLAANRQLSGGSALQKFFKADRKRAARDHEEAENYFIDTMTQSQLRPDATEVTLGKGFESIDGDAFMRATSKMLRVQQGKEPEDDRDSLVFKDLRSVGDFAYDKLNSYKTRTAIRNKMARQINQASTVRDVVRSETFSKPLRDTFINNSAANPARQINPVEMIASSMQTTIMGPGGIKSAQAIVDEAKLINNSHFGFLDPIHTPESEKTGVTLHLPVGVHKDGRDAKIPVYNLKTQAMERIPVKTFIGSNVVLPDQVEWDGDKPRFVSKTVKMAKDGNELVNGRVSEAHYVMRHPSQMFSITSNLIPFMGTTSGNRASYATHHIEQAISLVDREPPLVQVGTGVKKEGLHTFEELLGRHTAHVAPVDGTVAHVRKDGIIIQDKAGKKHEVQLYNNFPLNDPKAVLHSEPTVKVGAAVRKGQSIADTNFTRQGQLALGTNLTVAYIPFKGYNFEDGVVISQSAADKLSSVHMHKPSMALDANTSTDPKKFRNQHAGAFTKDQLKLVGDDGIVQVGTRVRPGDPLVLATRPYQLKDRTGRNAIRRVLTGVHTDASLRWDSDYEGEVVAVNRSKPGEVTVHVRTVEPMQIGDKIAGRYGNKGIVTQILPNHEMPKTTDGRHVEVALNPAGVPGRMNVGQVLETAAAKIAKKTGQKYVIENFGKEDDLLKKVQADLKKHGLSDTEELIDPVSGVSLGKALMGPQHMLKLTHQVDKKISARSGMAISGGAPEGYDFNLMPTGGGGTGGTRMGNLGMYALLAHGATSNIREMQTWKSEGPDPAPDNKRWRSQHEEVWKSIQNGDPLPTPKHTFSFQKFTDMLRASGINIEKKGNRMQLTPLTNAQVLQMSNGELKRPSALTRAKLDEDGNPQPVRGGLFDPKVTGGHGGKKWSHFELAEPMPNPVFEGAIQRVLGLTKNQYSDLVLGDRAIDPKSGDFAKVGAPGALTGGHAVAHMLRQLSVPKELKKAEKELEAVRVPASEGGLSYTKEGKKWNTQKLDAAYKKVKYLRALDQIGLSAEDAYTLKNIPVIPPAMRPASVLPDGSIKWADLNGLYAELAQLNEQMKDPRFKDALSDKDKRDSRAGLYDGVKSLMGIGMSHTDRQGKNTGILLQISGVQPKKGYFQNTLLNRRQDLTMRSTIVPEPAMGLDEVGLPTSRALVLFRPFVVRKLQDIGAARAPLEAQKLLDSSRVEKNSQVLRALDLVMEERPVLMKRDPALHKHSVQAFTAHRVPGRAIQIHPLVTSGYNADFDGDQMSVYVPISNEAVTEARRMFPSNNLFNEATGRVTNVPTLESALGLYKLSLVRGDGKKTMKDPASVLQAVEHGKLHINDKVTVSGIGATTAGRIMLSSAMPEGSALRQRVLTDHTMVLDKKGLPRLYETLAREHKGEFGEAANRLKDLGFDTTFGAIRVPNPEQQGPSAIKAAENPSKNTRFLPVGTHSLSLKDFEPDKDTRDRILQQSQRRVDMIEQSNMSRQVKDNRVVEEWLKATSAINKAHAVKAEKAPDNLFLMLKAGVKPKEEQYQQLKLAPMVVKDSSGRLLPTPVTRSYAEGLDLSGYWTQMHGARSGSVQKVQEVQEPGFFSKQLINTTMNLQVNGRDCGTQRGVALGVKAEDVHDRELAADLRVKGVTYPKGTVLRPDVVSQIMSADQNAVVSVRSPLKCEHAKGLCQKCAGLAPSGEHYPLGTNLGVLAAQSLGERAVQLTLKSFHTGGVAGAGGKVLGAFTRIEQLTKLPRKIPYSATLAMKSGTVEKVEHGTTGTDVWVDGQKHFVPLDRNGDRLTEELPESRRFEDYRAWSPIKAGQKVEAGQTLSDPNRTTVNPHDLYRAVPNIEKVQHHLTNELHGIFREEGVRRQHVETVVKAMSNLTRVKDPGDDESVLKGEYQPLSVVRMRNRELVQQGKKPILNEPILKGIDVMPLEVQEDWMAKLNFQRLRHSVRDAAATGAYSDLHGTHPIPGMVYAAEFGLTERQRRQHPHMTGLPAFTY
jgi:DNA-directed RNA polymerase subunit beta'